MASLLQREAGAPGAGLPTSKGQVNVIATMRAMAIAGDKGSGLVEMKAVDGGYPTVGMLETDPQLPPPSCSPSATAPSGPPSIRRFSRGST